MENFNDQKLHEELTAEAIRLGIDPDVLERAENATPDEQMEAIQTYAPVIVNVHNRRNTTRQLELVYQFDKVIGFKAVRK